MKLWQSNVGWVLAGLYLAVAVFLICSQGLFGESFIAVVLGLPWSALLVFIGAQGLGNLLYPAGRYAVVLFPIILNTSLLYLIGFGVEKLFRYLQPQRVYRKDGR